MSQIETIMSSKGAMIGFAVVAFLVAAILVLVIVRMLFGGRLRMPGGRARQARLGIVDAFDLDRQRQLIIVRRDNIEHLIMIGGPNDLLIESEIVRVEAREVRDQRRDKEPSFPADGRIPAPSPVEQRMPEPRPPVDEPLLPMPLPEVPAAASVEPIAESAPRAPTFPLPPRRPAPSPERRPPLLPEGVSRGDAAPMVASPGAMPVGAIDLVPPAGPAGPPLSPAAPPMTAPARTVPPPFLKPLPPRAPLRPLPRTTPVAPPPGAAAVPVLPPVPAPKVAAQPQPPKTTPAKPASPTPAPDSADALESLEEEMAKLLGRGPG